MLDSKNLIILLIFLILFFYKIEKNKSLENYSNGTLENVKSISIDEKLKILHKAYTISKGGYIIRMYKKSVLASPSKGTDNLLDRQKARTRKRELMKRHTKLLTFFYFLVKNTYDLYELVCRIKNIDNNYYNLDCNQPSSIIKDGTFYNIYEEITEVFDICKNKHSNSEKFCIDLKTIFNNLIVECINFIENNDTSCPCIENDFFSYNYVGCFKEKKDRYWPRDLPIRVGNSSIEECAKSAYELKKRYFGVQNQNGIGGGNTEKAECWVGNKKAGDYGGANNCKQIKNNTWGQNWSNAVYKMNYNKNQDYYYKGCFKDKNNRDLPKKLASSSNLAWCAKSAKELNKKYFGLQYQNGIGRNNKEKAECWVGNNYGKHGHAYNCKKINNNTWGQNWSNAVYHIPDDNKKKCSPC